jgi:hypothetical protein
MYICGGNTIWAYTFTLIEYILIALIAYLYTTSVIQIYKNKETYNYENIDLILIILSLVQVYILVLEIFTDTYIGFKYMIGIFKFSQNSIITGCLLFQIMLWQHYQITLTIVKYFIMSMIIFDVVTIFIIMMFETSFFEINYCRSLVLCTLVVVSIAMDVGVLLYALYKRFMENNENSSLNLLTEEDDQYNLSKIIQKYTYSIRTMKNYYLIITAIFTVSFIIDIYWKFYLTGTRNEDSGGLNAVNCANITNDANNVTFNSTLLLEETMGDSCIGKANNNTCYYYGNLGDDYSFTDFLLCNFTFLFKDLSPHVYIYFALFRFKHNLISRSSSLIEPL